MNMDRFLQNFQRAVDELRYNESRANFQMLDTIYTKPFGDFLCDHAAEVYTPTMLTIFLEQAHKVGYLKFDCRRESNETEEVEVHICSRDATHDCSTVKHYVIKTENGFHQCCCKQFNFLGVICSHILWMLK